MAGGPGAEPPRLMCQGTSGQPSSFNTRFREIEPCLVVENVLLVRYPFNLLLQKIPVEWQHLIRACQIPECLFRVQQEAGI